MAGHFNKRHFHSSISIKNVLIYIIIYVVGTLFYIEKIPIFTSIKYQGWPQIHTNEKTTKQVKNRNKTILASSLRWFNNIFNKLYVALDLSELARRAAPRARRRTTHRRCSKSPIGQISSMLHMTYCFLKASTKLYLSYIVLFSLTPISKCSPELLNGGFGTTGADVGSDRAGQRRQHSVRVIT